MQDVDASVKESAAKGKKTFIGKVVSTKMQNTITVLIEEQKQQDRYKKIIKKRKRFMADQPGDIACSEGDFVEIEECRPVSKNKFFRLKRVISSVTPLSTPVKEVEK